MEKDLFSIYYAEEASLTFIKFKSIDFVNKSRESTRLGINATIFETGNVDTSSPQKYVKYSTKVF